MRSLTFRGRQSATIPAGQVTASDAAALHVTPLEPLTVTLFLAGVTGPATFHDDGLTTTYQATGDHVRDSGAVAFDGTTSHSYYYLTGVDVPTRRPGTVVAFGDSITNGHNSTVGGNARYTDALAGRLIAAHSPLSVANAGISGNLLLHQLPCFGETGISRFARDALGQPGVRTVILMEGPNDIWVLSSGEYDAVADFAAAVADPADPQQLNPRHDSGDHLHPHDAGYRAIAAAINIDSLEHP